MKDGVEADAEAARLAHLLLLAGVSDTGDGRKVGLEELRVVVHKQSWALEGCSAGESQLGQAVAARVETEAHNAGSRVVRVLDELSQDAGALRIGAQDFAQPGAQVHALPEGGGAEHRSGGACGAQQPCTGCVVIVSGARYGGTLSGKQDDTVFEALRTPSGALQRPWATRLNRDR